MNNGGHGSVAPLQYGDTALPGIFLNQPISRVTDHDLRFSGIKEYTSVSYDQPIYDYRRGSFEPIPRLIDTKAYQ